MSDFFDGAYTYTSSQIMSAIESVISLSLIRRPSFRRMLRWKSSRVSSTSGISELRSSPLSRPAFSKPTWLLIAADTHYITVYNILYLVNLLEVHYHLAMVLLRQIELVNDILSLLHGRSNALQVWMLQRPWCIFGWWPEIQVTPPLFNAKENKLDLYSPDKVTAYSCGFG